MENKSYKFFDLIIASFVAVLLISNIASTKMVNVGPFVFDGGTILFPLAYIFGDILTEVYGYKKSRKVIWTGFVWIFIASGIFYIVDVLPHPNDYPFAESFHNILGQTPRIVLASLVAYFVGEFANSFVLAKLKVITNRKHLWIRTISSTLVGEGLDTILFIAVAFYGILPTGLLISVFVSNYIFKVGIETVLTPITYIIVNHLKKIENEDYFDVDTKFNPFIVR